MERLPACPLFQSGKNGPVCLGGVNFLAVGEDRALCHHCELLKMEGLEVFLSCEHLEVYTHLTYHDQQPLVRPIFECDLRIGAPAEKRCAACPALVTSSQRWDATV